MLSCQLPFQLSVGPPILEWNFVQFRFLDCLRGPQDAALATVHCLGYPLKAPSDLGLWAPSRWSISADLRSPGPVTSVTQKWSR